VFPNSTKERPPVSVPSPCVCSLTAQKNHPPVLGYPTKIFSLKNKDKFLEYLNSIKNDMSKEHLAKVIEVYGEDHLKPYVELFNEK